MKNIFKNRKNKVIILVIIVIILILGLIVYRVTVEQVEETPVPSETATPESATSEVDANADGYGEETLMQTEDGSYLDGEASDDRESLNDEEASEKPAATATPAPVATATPRPVQATPQPTTAPQPAATNPPQQTVTQPDQSYDSTVDDLWTDDAWVSDDEYNEAMDAMSGLEFE